MNLIQQTSIFASWLTRLGDSKARARIVARIESARNGNFGDTQPIDDGVSEMRIDFGPGYRVYYMREGSILYLLLCGGDKSTQRADISNAIKMARQVRQEVKAHVGDAGALASRKPKPRKG